MSEQVITAPPTPISPAELVLTMLNEQLDRKICLAGAVVGPASHEAQQEGIVSLTDAGPQLDRYSPVVKARIQIRCMANKLATCDLIGYHVASILHNRHREVIKQPSTGLKYLSYRCNVTAGPSAHFDSAVTWEALMFVEIEFHQDPL